MILQLESLSIPFLSAEDLPWDMSKDFDIIVDAILGVSFHGKQTKKCCQAPLQIGYFNHLMLSKCLQVHLYLDDWLMGPFAFLIIPKYS